MGRLNYCLSFIHTQLQVSCLNLKRVQELGVIMLPQSFMSLIVPCHPVENNYMSEKKNKGPVSHVPESLCFSKEMIADPFHVSCYSEFKTGVDYRKE